MHVSISINTINYDGSIIEDDNIVTEKSFYITGNLY